VALRFFVEFVSVGVVYCLGWVCFFVGSRVGVVRKTKKIQEDRRAHLYIPAANVNNGKPKRHRQSNVRFVAGVRL
jgi:uncharacterized membrane protein